LHESPACTGITHDPEVKTAFGNVYWAFDSTGNNQNGQLVRFDFQQPHGPGSMDHSVASVRRFPEVILKRGAEGVHAGMIIHPLRRELFISNPGDGTILVVNPDSGTFARTAREEYPIFSNRLPSFEYSVWDCVDQDVFASDIEMPSGLALSQDGERLFVAEHESGKIHVFEVASRALLTTIETKFSSIGGLDISPTTGHLYFVDSKTNSLQVIVPEIGCSTPYYSRLSEEFVTELLNLGSSIEVDSFSLIRDYQCTVDPIIPDASFFDQVHVDSGYASNDTNVQNDAGMDANAALLANRTDCGIDSELNFDALLLGGYFCHVCLPQADCDASGTCTNVQWDGYICDNEFIVLVDDLTNTIKLQNADGKDIDTTSLILSNEITYRFTIRSPVQISLHDSEEFGTPAISLPGNECGCATKGPLLVTLSNYVKESVFLHSETGAVLKIQLHSSQADRLNIFQLLMSWIVSLFLLILNLT